MNVWRITGSTGSSYTLHLENIRTGEKISLDRYKRNKPASRKGQDKDWFKKGAYVILSHNPATERGTSNAPMITPASTMQILKGRK